MLFIERAAARGQPGGNLEPLAQRVAVGYRHPPCPAVAGRCPDGLRYFLSCLLALRKLPAKPLLAIGVMLFLLPIANDFWMQSVANSTNASLAGIWTEPGADIAERIGLTMLFGYFMRGLGLIIMGAGLYRLGFMQGEASTRTYRMTAMIGLGIGLPLATLGVLFVAINDFSKEMAFIGSIPNNLGTIPTALGYMSLIILWNQRMENWLKR